VWDFIRNELVQGKADDWQNLIDGFRAKHGKDIADSIPYWLHWIYWRTNPEQDAKFLHEQAIASEILTSIFPS
jgi:hypothetical protein